MPKSVMIKARTLLPCLLIACCLLFDGCGATEQLGDERFFGSWRFKQGRVHTIITFRATGTWASDVRISDRFEKIVDKRGKVQGKWVVEEGSLKIIPESGFESDWKVGRIYDYEIVEINKDYLRLKDHLGRVKKWIRVRGQQQGQKGISVSNVSLGPIVVNVKKSEKYIKERYLCIDLQLVISTEGEGQATPAVHPKVREAAILNLSSLTFDELNTNKKIGRLKTKIRSILNPYMQGKIDDVIVNEVIVTRKWDVVEEFLGISQAERPGDGEEQNETGDDGDPEEKGRSENAGDADKKDHMQS